jgi:glycosyltransferase involved in cell wall biosynthesis
LIRSGHRASILYRHSANGMGRDRRTEEGVTVWAVWAGRVGPLKRYLATFHDSAIDRVVERVLDELQPDLVHVQHLMGLPVQLVSILARRRIPYVITLHDYWWVCANAQVITNYSRQICPGPDRLWLNCARCALARSGARDIWPGAPAVAPLFGLRGRLLRGVLLKADGVIAPMPFVKAWYAVHGLPADRIHILRHGIERPPTEIVPRSEHSCVRFAYMGGLSWQKGVHILVEAFNRIHGKSELWIAGDESFDPAYSRHLHTLAGSRIRFLGVLDRPQVWDHLAQVDVVVVPSLWYETLSLIAHEAFVAGLPVIASRLGVLADVVRDGVDGLLVAPGDVAAWQAAMQRLLDDARELEHLRAGVRPPPTMDEHIAALTLLYDQVTNQA